MKSEKSRGCVGCRSQRESPRLRPEDFGMSAVSCLCRALLPSLWGCTVPSHPRSRRRERFLPPPQRAPLGCAAPEFGARAVSLRQWRSGSAFGGLKGKRDVPAPGLSQAVEQCRGMEGWPHNRGGGSGVCVGGGRECDPACSCTLGCPSIQGGFVFSLPFL